MCATKTKPASFQHAQWHIGQYECPELPERWNKDVSKFMATCPSTQTILLCCI